jgi:hypothetical protein
VDVHFTRCAALQEYLVMSALYDQPPRQSRIWYALMVPLVGVAVIVAYGFWTHAFRIDRAQPIRSPSPVVAEQRPSEMSKQVSSSSSNRTTSLDSENGQGETSPPIEPVETPKAVSVTELLGLQGPAEQARPTVRASSPGAATSDVQVGDMLHVTGWVQRISRAPDSSYHLYVSPNRQNGTQMMVATVPPPNQGQGSSAGQAQLQTVRTFIRQQLLRQQEPSPRGSVMQRPIFVQLTGQLSIPTVPPAVPSRGKGSQAIRARWELRPLLEVQFATPAETSDRARPQ